jgi:hypothetical protein
MFTAVEISHPEGTFSSSIWQTKHRPIAREHGVVMHKSGTHAPSNSTLGGSDTLSGCNSRKIDLIDRKLHIASNKRPRKGKGGVLVVKYRLRVPNGTCAAPRIFNAGSLQIFHGTIGPFFLPVDKTNLLYVCTT